MKHKVRIEVTQEMISAGERGSCSLCPIALAVMHAGLAPHVSVNEGMVFLFDHESNMLAKAHQTDEAKDFIGAFDHEGPRYDRAKPFATVLEFTDQVSCGTFG